MNVLERANVGSLSRCLDPTRMSVRGSYKDNEIEDSAPAPTNDVHWGACQFPRNDKAAVRGSPAHSVRTPRHNKER